MRLFSKNKEREVQTFILHLMNNHCPGLSVLDHEDSRRECRANLTLVVLVVPLQDGKPDALRAFPAVTKEFACSGVSLVLDQPLPLEEAYLIFREESRVTYVLARAKHLSPMGGGFFQLGMEMTEIVSEEDCPELKPLADEFH